MLKSMINNLATRMVRSLSGFETGSFVHTVYIVYYSVNRTYQTSNATHCGLYLR